MHQSVLLNEVVQCLNIKPEGRYVDGTLGAGGHAEAILKNLNEKGRLLGLDVDPDQMALAKSRLQPFGDRTITRLVNFRGLQGVLKEVGWAGVDGMIFDLGVSSDQLDQEKRGLSFKTTGPLDMRLDPSLSETALSCLQKMEEAEIASLLQQFGEGRFSRRLSRALVRERKSGSLRTTSDLSRLCERVMGRRFGRTHPATRVFLALRSLVNDELGALKDLLEAAPPLINGGGRLAVISFHSLEDRLVKEKFRDLEKQGLAEKKFRRATKKPIIPSPLETTANARSRSAKLRVLERIV